MRFLIGLLLGFALGFAAVILLAPQRPRESERAREVPPKGEGESAGGENHDFMAPLRRAMRSLKGQAREAWAEAVEAAEETEKEMRVRYQRMARRTAQSDQ